MFLHQSNINSNKNNLLPIVLILGTVIRFLCIYTLPNYDYYSWEIVADLFCDNQNIYNSTTRYNYGPTWFFILGFLRNIPLDFRFSLISFLTIVDLLIVFLLLKMDKFNESLLFYLCPISIIISGYHLQFDNFAILIVFFSISYLARKHGLNVRFRDLKGEEMVFLAIAIGLSLITKHIFIFFPIWLFFQSGIISKKLFIVFFPILLFISSFILFWNTGYQGIIKNVFQYSSFNNYPFYKIIFPEIFDIINKWKFPMMKVIFFIMVISSGYILRKKTLLESFLFYTACFVCFSAAIANQYLAIPILFLSFQMFTSSVLYYIVGLIFLVFIDNSGGMRILGSQFFKIHSIIFYKTMISLLFISILSTFFNRDILREFFNSLVKQCFKILSDIQADTIHLFKIKK